MYGLIIELSLLLNLLIRRMFERVNMHEYILFFDIVC